MKSSPRIGSKFAIRSNTALLAVIFALTFGSVWSGWALDPAKSIDQFNCRNWTRQNGLPVDKISGVAQTKDGYLWLGTQNGLLRFDGKEFKSAPIDLPAAKGQDIWKLTTAPDGSLRFCINNGGFGGFDGHKFFPAVPAEESGWRAQTIMVARDGATWVGSNDGWGRWLPASPTNKFSIGETKIGIVLCMGEDEAGGIWLGTSEQGLFLWQAGKMVARFSDPSLMAKGISALAADGTNRLWIGTTTGLHRLTDGKIIDFPGFYNVSALLVDRNGTLWVGTVGNGLLRYEKGQFVALTKADGLVSDFVTSLFEDAEGNLWVGTRDGLSQLSDLKFPIVSGKQGVLSGSCHAVAADATDGLWIAAAIGLSHFNYAKPVNFTSTNLTGSSYFKVCFVARNGEVYAEDGDKNIDIFSGGKLAGRVTNSVWISAFGEDAEGILVGRGSGQPLFRLKDGQFVPYQYRGGSPSYYWINNLCCAHDGAIWVASNNGLYRVQNGVVQQWGTAQGLPDLTVQCVFEDTDGSIWAGLTAGLVRIKNGQLKCVKIENGLADNCVYSIVPDDFGSFWFYSSRAIFRASRENLNDFADGKSPRVACEVFDGSENVKAYGRTDQEFSGCKTADGRIWFPSPWGVFMIDPSHLPTNRVAPPVHIGRVQANGREFSPADRIIIPPGAGQLTLEFSALSYVAPDKIQFRYRLDGLDKNWVEANGHRQAAYANVKPGLYNFQVIAANADGVWNRAGDAVQIELRPHFQQTAAFYFLCGGLGLALLGGFYALRVRHFESKQRALQSARDELEREVSRRTGELAESRHFLDRIINSIGDPIFVKNQQYHNILVNDAFCNLLGLKREDLLGKSSDDHAPISVEEANTFKSTDRVVFDTGRENINEEKLTSSDGTIHDILTKKSLYIGEKGEKFLVGVTRDVTNQKQIEREIIESRIFLDRIINSISDPVHVVDRQHRWVLVNDAACDFVGLAREKILGKTPHDVFSKDSADLVWAKNVQVFETGREQVFEQELTDHTGAERVIVTKKNLYVDKNGGRFIVSVVQDITERKRADAELAYERDLLRALLDNSPGSIFFKDLQSRFVKISRSEAANLHRIALIRHHAAHPEEAADTLPPHLASLDRFHEYVIGKSDFDIYGPDAAKRFFEDEQDIIRTGQPMIGKVEKAVASDGTNIWHLVTKVPWRNPEGNIIGTFGTAQDISDLKDAESRAETAHQRLLDVSRQAGMAEVATNVLHNVGNVLNSVNVSASLVSDNAKKSKLSSLARVVELLNEHSQDLGAFLTTDPRGRQLLGYLNQLTGHLNLEQQQAVKELELLRQNVGHIKDIVAMQQNYAKISGVVESVKVTDLVEDALRINGGALARHGIQIIREYSEVPTLPLEKHRVLQILVNLIRNAKYACDDSGRQDKQLKLRVSNPDSVVKIEVMDNGIGIPPENMTRIFSHGFTTRKSGHGFGLHSGALAAQEMGGSLTAQSDGTGQGAAFILTLPVRNAKTAAQTSPTSSKTTV